jgi:hypothetical protein
MGQWGNAEMGNANAQCGNDQFQMQELQSALAAKIAIFAICQQEDCPALAKRPKVFRYADCPTGGHA